MVSTKRKNTTPVLLAPAQVLSIKTSLQNSVCLPTQGRGELNEKKLNLTSPWKNLSRRYLFMSESLDRTDPCRRRHAQPCENKCSENSQPETRLRNTSHILFLSLSMCLCQTVSCYCLTHAHKHKPELSNKAYPVTFTLTFQGIETGSRSLEEIKEKTKPKPKPELLSAKHS